MGGGWDVDVGVEENQKIKSSNPPGVEWTVDFSLAWVLRVGCAWVGVLRGSGWDSRPRLLDLSGVRFLGGGRGGGGILAVSEVTQALLLS